MKTRTSFRPRFECLESREVPALIFALTADNTLATFDSNTPGTVLSNTAITGVAAGDTLISIDFSPGNGSLFAIGRNGNVLKFYSINPTTGAATARVPHDIPSFGSVTGSNYAIDINPVTNRPRVVGDGDENFVFTVNLPTPTAETKLAYVAGDANDGANPAVISIAYNANSNLATNTTVFGIDAGTDSLVRIGSPGGNPDGAGTGKLTTIGALGVNAVAGATGFDIADGTVSIAFVSFAPDTAAGSRAELRRVNTTTGVTTAVGQISPSGAGGFNVRDIAVALVGHLSLFESSVTVNESQGTATFTVNRSVPSQVPTTVSFELLNGSAKQGTDFTLSPSPVTFQPGETAKTITVTLANDRAIEGTETALLRLSNSTNGASTDASETLTITIEDDDQPPTISDIGDQSGFVSVPVGPVAFTVTDNQTPTGNLTVTAKSSNQSLLPDSGIVLGGSGSSRTLTLNPIVGRTGTATVTVTVDGGSGATATDTFQVTFAPRPSTLGIGGQFDGTAQVLTANAGGQFTTALAATLAPFGAVPANVRTATADVNGDTIPDTVLVTGPGTPIRVAIVSGADNATVLVAPFDPFGGDFLGGGFVTAGDFDRDGRSEFVVTPDQGGGPRISIFSLGTGGAAALRANFLTIEESFRGGARPGAGDINRDGVPDLVVSAGFLGGPRIVVLNGQRVLSVSNFTSDADKLVGDFFAFSPELRNGAYVAVGDVNGDGFGDLVFGAGPGGGPEIRIASGQTLLTAGSTAALSGAIADFFLAGDLNNRGGVRVAVKDADGDGRADVVAGTGGGQASFARVYLGRNFTSVAEPATFQDLDPFAGAVLADGVYVG